MASTDAEFLSGCATLLGFLGSLWKARMISMARPARSSLLMVQQ